jgi:hypothetical protein
MSDIFYSSEIQKLLVRSDYKTNSIATDEDGYSHRIDFDNGANNGSISTENGKIVWIEENTSVAHNEDSTESPPRRVEALVRQRAQLGMILNQIINITHLLNGGTMVDCSEKLEQLKNFVEDALGESAKRSAFNLRTRKV